MHGVIRGIAGNAVRNIQALEMDNDVDLID